MKTSINKHLFPFTKCSSYAVKDKGKTVTKSACYNYLRECSRSSNNQPSYSCEVAHWECHSKPVVGHSPVRGKISKIMYKILYIHLISSWHWVQQHLNRAYCTLCLLEITTSSLAMHCIIIFYSYGKSREHFIWYLIISNCLLALTGITSLSLIYIHQYFANQNDQQFCCVILKHHQKKVICDIEHAESE